MFCSTCGAAITPELNYCKRCGKELTGAVKQSETEIESLIWAIVSITVGGIGVIIGLMAVMKNAIGFNNEMIAFIAFLCFVLISIADAAFIWMLVNRARTMQKPTAKSQLKEAASHQLYEVPARELAEPMPFSSVTEHTTRTLEAIPRESKK